MRLLILGASGGVGRHVVRLALDQGHSVTALVRRADGIDPRARVVVDDVLRPGCLAEHTGGHDAVLSSLGLKRRSPANPWSALVSPPDFCSRTATTLVAAMKLHGVRCLVALSAAGVAESAPRMNALMKFFVSSSKVGIAYRDLAVMEGIYAASDLDWCCPRPTRLTTGLLTRNVKVIDDFPMLAAISRADVAWWMIEQAARPIAVALPTITGA